jgi:hypothetical protein
MDWIGWTCWAVMGLAVVLALWALFWDRSRGRLRCRRCAYDMSGGQLVCPECGREHKNEKMLKKTRRRWKTAALGLLLAMLAIHTKASQSYIEREGMIGVVPSFVLIPATDATDYPDYVFGGFEAESLWARTLCERIDANQTSLWTRKLFASKVARGWDGEQVGVQNASAYSVVYDLSHTAPLAKYRYYSYCFPRKGQSPDLSHISNEQAMVVFEIVAEHSLPDTWRCFGGDLSAEIYVGEQLVVSASSDVHSLLKSNLKELEQNVWSPGADLLFDGHENMFVRYKMNWVVGDDDSDPFDRIYDMCEHMEDMVGSEMWEDNSGQSALEITDFDIVVWTTPDHHREIIEYLNSVDLEALVGN